MKLTIVIATVNQLELTEEAITRAISNLDHPEETELLVIDNGSDGSMQERTAYWESKNGRGIAWRALMNEANSGNYPVFFQAQPYTTGELIAFIHNDVFILEKGWDTKVRAQFDARPEMGLLGFIGSTQIDSMGGRGSGTVSNMRAVEWQGRTMSSDAHIHGRQDAGMTVDGSVVDGCVMIFRRSVLEQIPEREDFVKHHFYDRLFSCQVIELGYRVGILGVEFAHLNGQVANQEQKWQQTSAAWFKLKHNIDTPQQWAELRKDWVANRNQPSSGKVPDQWDYASYLEGEYLFLSEYRDQKHLVPMHNGKRV